jgi:hypothetical protein
MLRLLVFQGLASKKRVKELGGFSLADALKVARPTTTCPLWPGDGDWRTRVDMATARIAGKVGGAVALE